MIFPCRVTTTGSCCRSSSSRIADVACVSSRTVTTPLATAVLACQPSLSVIFGLLRHDVSSVAGHSVRDEAEAEGPSGATCPSSGRSVRTIVGTSVGIL